jgi:outer membrane protein assembly factor BamA
MSKKILLFSLFLGFIHFTWSQDSLHVKPSKSFLSYFGVTPMDDTIVKHKNGLFFTPLLYFSPDTRWGFGGAGVYAFHLKDKKDTTDYTRASYIQFLADYTLNRQTDVWSVWSIFTRQERYYFKGEMRFRNFPDRFYGIGNNTPIANEEFYSYNLISFKSLFLRKIYQKFFVGFDYHFSNEFGFNLEPGGVLESGTITGYKGGIGSGIGAVAILDTRDNVINSYTGDYAEIATYYYTKYLGSTFSFTDINGQYLKFWELRPKHVLAWQTRTRLTFGDTPFLDLSMVGNDDLLRGYPKNRYRDKHFFGTQLEYRFPLFWRFGMVGFAGAGDVFSRPQDLSWRTMKYSVGMGLRILVNAAERLNIRVDYGYGSGGGYFYFSVAEAF